MSSALIIAQLLIQLLPTLQTGVSEAIAFITKVKSAAQQTGEWTPAIDAAFQQALKDSGNDPAYQPDPPAAAAP